MNNRDPFNLRSTRATPLTHLRSSSSHALASTTRALSNAVFQAESTAAKAPDSMSDAMSFAIPRHVPGTNQYEGAAWGSSQRSRHSTNAQGAAAGVAEKIGGMFGDHKNRLPMYKDKPFHSQYGSGKRKAWWSKRRTVGIGAMVVLMIFYWMGWPAKRSTGKDAKKEKSSWILWGTPAKPDWDWRKERVKDAFKISWSAYEEHAWGYDEFHPIAKNGRQMAGNGLGWIIVDALDTLILMNLTTELTHAREWISTTLNYDIDHDVNTFETTIRMLGGLLSAHYLANKFPDMAPIQLAEGQDEDDLYLEKATDLADRLLGAYDSPTGIPYASVNLHTMKGIRSHVDGGSSSTAEATTLQLEMKYLAQLTGEGSYWEKTEYVMKAIDDIGAKDGLVPIFVNPDRGVFYGENIRLGSRGDSYYEYLIKQYHQTSNQEPIYLDMWEEAMRGVRKHLITYSYPSNLTVLAERQNGLGAALTPKMDHLVCFMPSAIALGATGGKSLAEAKKAGWTQKQEDDIELAAQLLKTCWAMYKHTKTGLAPEIAYFNTYDPPQLMRDQVLHSAEELDPTENADWRQDIEIHQADRHNLQRPETVESLFYMWRITGDVKYREWGWQMFESFVQHTITDDGKGFSSIQDVTRTPPVMRDNMESFWLAETLKYMYLLFSDDDVLPLDQVVFNTEAHPMPRFELGKLFKTGWTRKTRDVEGNVKPSPPIPEERQLTKEEKIKIQKILSEKQLEADEAEESEEAEEAEEADKAEKAVPAKISEKEATLELERNPVTGEMKAEKALKE